MKVPSFGEQIKILDAGCFFEGQVNAYVWGPTRFFTPPGLNSWCFSWDWKNASEWCSAWEGSWFHAYPDKSIGVSAEHASAGTRVLSASTRVPEQLRLDHYDPILIMAQLSSVPNPLPFRQYWRAENGIPSLWIRRSLHKIVYTGSRNPGEKKKNINQGLSNHCWTSSLNR